MSCYQVSPTTVDLLVSAAVEAGLPMTVKGRTVAITEGMAPLIAELLWQTNIVSVGYRYDNLAAAEADAGPYQFRLYRDVIPSAALGCANCFEYQACEPPDWNGSDVCALVAAVRSMALAKGASKENAPWGVNSALDALAKGFARSTNIVGFRPRVFEAV